MKRWKFIDFPEETQLLQDLKDWFPSTSLMHSDYNWNPIDVAALMAAVPRLKAGLDHFGVHATYAVCIHKGHHPNPREAEAEGIAPIIHVDHMPGVKARLLFPVLNCAGSSTVFYDCTSAGNFQPYDDGLPSLQFRPEDCVEIDRIELLRPIIIRIDKPHAVQCNLETLPRVSLSLRLNKDPVRWMFK